MSGPDTRLAIMAAVTVIEKDDVASHFLDHPDFESIRVGQIVTWPTGFKEKTSAARKLWEEWNKVRVEGLALHDDGKAARRFYRQHKAELTDGLTVSWKNRFDKKRGDPDAMFAALFDFYRLGEAAFMSERQNEPLQEAARTVYNLDTKLVASRIHADREPYEIPA